MFDCVRAAFEEIDKDSLHDHGDGGRENDDFFRGLQVLVTAAEVGGGEVIDLLRSAGGWDDDPAPERSSGGDDNDSTHPPPTYDAQGRPLIAVRVHSPPDFNRLVGVVSSSRSSSPHSHLVVKAKIMSSDGLWATLCWADVRVPCVEEGVLYGDDEEEDDNDWSRGGKSPTRSTRHQCVVHSPRIGVGGGREKAHKLNMGKDALYAQEDSSSLCAVLEARSLAIGGAGAAAWTGSRLVEALGGEVLGGKSAVRCFVHVPSGGGKEDALDAATGMLFAECARGEV